MSPTPCAKSFYQSWLKACAARHDHLFAKWSDSPAFTSAILYEDDSIIKAIAAEAAMECYCGYYDLDAILFRAEDRVPDAPVGQTWVRRIRVAFEHENFFNSGLFQELSHLMITRCDLRVVVSYPDNDWDLDFQLTFLHRIVHELEYSHEIADSDALLFVVGFRDVEQAKIEWRGYVYKHDGWRVIEQDDSLVQAVTPLP